MIADHRSDHDSEFRVIAFKFSIQIFVSVDWRYVPAWSVGGWAGLHFQRFSRRGKGAWRCRAVCAVDRKRDMGEASNSMALPRPFDQLRLLPLLTSHFHFALLTFTFTFHFSLLASHFHFSLSLFTSHFHFSLLTFTSHFHFSLLTFTFTFTSHFFTSHVR